MILSSQARAQKDAEIHRIAALKRRAAALGFQVAPVTAAARTGWTRGCIFKGQFLAPSTGQGLTIAASEDNGVNPPNRTARTLP